MTGASCDEVHFEIKRASHLATCDVTPGELTCRTPSNPRTPQMATPRTAQPQEPNPHALHHPTCRGHKHSAHRSKINNPKGPTKNLVTRPLTQRDPNAGPRPQGAATSRTNPTRLTATTLPAIRCLPHPTTSKAREVPKQKARRSHAHHPQVPVQVPATEPPRPRGHPIWTRSTPRVPWENAFSRARYP